MNQAPAALGLPMGDLVCGLMFHARLDFGEGHVFAENSMDGERRDRHTNETASGWQQVLFASPVAITANTTYVASYHMPNGGYSVDRPSFATAVDNPPLHALASSTSGGNGVYAYAAGSTFPTNVYQSSNYWVDVVFTPSQQSNTPTPSLLAQGRCSRA